MSKQQFWTLNAVGGICTLLITINLVVAQMDVRLNNRVVGRQNQFENAQRLRNTAQSLITRIAQSGQADAALNQLLIRHDFKVNLNTNADQGTRTP